MSSYFSIWGNKKYHDIVTNKRVSSNAYIRYMLSRTQSMFRYSGLPETIPQRMLELYLQTNGNCIIAEHKNNLYAFVGGLGGQPDPYYLPTIYTVANPALELSKNYNIGQDCVFIPNDSLWTGLMPMFAKYSQLLVENDITMLVSNINIRLSAILSAKDDRTKLALDKMIDDISDGKLASILDKNIMDDGSINVQTLLSNSGANYISQLIEMEQYLKAGWFNDLGLQANYNMKRESINSNEAQLNEDSLLPFVDDMLRCRQTGVEQINSMFGTSISVELYSSWVEDENSGQPETVGDDENVLPNSNT